MLDRPTIPMPIARFIPSVSFRFVSSRGVSSSCLCGFHGSRWSREGDWGRVFSLTAKGVRRRTTDTQTARKRMRKKEREKRIGFLFLLSLLLQEGFGLITVTATTIVTVSDPRSQSHHCSLPAPSFKGQDTREWRDGGGGDRNVEKIETENKTKTGTNISGSRFCVCRFESFVGDCWRRAWRKEP